jgi:hypothetical protein
MGVALLAGAMVPAPGTPVGGERPSRQLAAASGGAMDVDSGVAAAVDDIPMAAAPAPGQGRLYCPVPGCPCADPARAPGWQSESTLRATWMPTLAAPFLAKCLQTGCRHVVVSDVGVRLERRYPLWHPPNVPPCSPGGCTAGGTETSRAR